MNIKTDVEAIKEMMLKNEELKLFKEEGQRLLVIRLTPLHAPLPITKSRIYTSEKSFYHQLHTWVLYELNDGIFTHQINLQVMTKDMYHTIGVDVCIEKLNEPDEFTFTKFSDEAEVDMNFIRPFSVF